MKKVRAVMCAEWVGGDMNADSNDQPESSMVYINSGDFPCRLKTTSLTLVIMVRIAGGSVCGGRGFGIVISRKKSKV